MRVTVHFINPGKTQTLWRKYILLPVGLKLWTLQKQRKTKTLVFISDCFNYIQNLQ